MQMRKAKRCKWSKSALLKIYNPPSRMAAAANPSMYSEQSSVTPIYTIAATLSRGKISTGINTAIVIGIRQHP
jgi:hypothetical protein